ncbi:hypothetical protein CSAL01_09923 [Colletotrichum salicis]|uniref:Amidohydrolase-related domain-containing protein n=1 Tax=Colletotrichum salicis TaxID=1209931 RepID=A0A135T0K5_9PEZI|nr:hypothetical protein CSAL01_09923 [Colletotrichum salicis]
MEHNNSFVLKDVKVFTGHETIDKGYVYVKNGIISQVGTGGFAGDSKDGLLIISRPGDTVIPGLIDAHIHALGGDINSIEQSLRFGVTKVCDMHNEPSKNAKLKELANLSESKSTYADFKCAGLGAVIEGGWPIPVIRRVFANNQCGDHIVDQIVSTWPILHKPEDAESFVKQQVEENGASYIKMFHEIGDTLGIDLPRPPMDIQKSVVAAAHKYCVVTTGHAFSYAGAMDLLRAGADGLSHMFLDKPPSDDYVQVMLDNKAHCNPTLGQSGEPMGMAAKQKPMSSVLNAYANTKALYEAGVPLILGTDAAGGSVGLPYGLGMHMEMRVLIKEVGMSPLDVLKSATSITAERLKFPDRGRVESGRKADLVLVEGDVLEALSLSDGKCLPIKAVWRDGVFSSSFTL